MALNLVVVGVSYAVSVISSLYGVFHFHGAHYETPFSCLGLVIALYWAVTLSSQAVFVMRVAGGDTSRPVVDVAPHFVINNAAHAVWVYLFTRGQFVLGLIVLVVNLLNLLMMYMNHKTSQSRTLRDWLTIHFPVVGWPLSWTVYAIFWNGACVFHSHNKGLFPRLVANVAIWEFLVLPLALLGLYGDWSVGLSTALLMLGVGLKQLFHRIVALQWAFALSISALDALASVVVMFSSALNAEEDRPLISSV